MGGIAEAREKTLNLLTQGMKLQVQVDGDGDILVKFSDTSTAVWFTFSEQEFEDGAPTQGFVHINAPILREVAKSAELYEWLVTQGTMYRIGFVRAIHAEDGTISLMFRYALLADYLDEDELSTAMWSVIGTADELDEELQKQFGGKRWVD